MLASFRREAIGGLVLLLATLPVHAATIEVTIERLSFQPSSITATAGDTIRWVNKDVMAHTATAADGYDVLIPPHQAMTTVVSQVGAIDYYCRFHPNMRGRIDVQPQ